MDIIGNLKKIDKKVENFCYLEENTGKKKKIFFAGNFFLFISALQEDVRKENKDHNTISPRLKEKVVG